MEISTFFYLLGCLGLFFCCVELIESHYKNSHKRLKKLKSEKSNQDFDDKLKLM